MKAIHKILVSTVSAVGFVSAANFAQAADIIEQPPAPPSVPMETPPMVSYGDWAGAYAGIALGYGFGGKSNVSGPGLNGEVKSKGFVGNGFAGWNWQNNGFVYGIEADAGYNAMKGSNAGIERSAGFDGTLRARLGVSTERMLFYGTAGGAVQPMKLSEGGVSDTKTMIGWTAGAGVDAKLTERVFGRLEYRYTKFGDKTFNTGSGAHNVSESSNKVMLGLGVKF